MKWMNEKKKKIAQLKPNEDVYIVTKGFYSLTVTSYYEAKHYNKVHENTFIRCSEFTVSQWFIWSLGAGLTDFYHKTYSNPQTLT